MSRYHENICWQSADGTWSCGFYAVAYYPDDPDDEWGVEFSDDFQWVSSGHATAEDAFRAWPGANPGYTSHLQYGPESAGEISDLEMKAAELEERDQARARPDIYGWGRNRDYNGPSRLSDPAILKAMAEKYARAVAETRCAQIGYRLDGYANDVTETLAELRRRRDDYTRRAKAAGATRIDDGSKALLDGLRELKERDDKRRQERSTYRGYGYQPVAASRSEARQELDAELAKAEAAAKPAMAGRAKPSGVGQRRVQAGVPSGGQFASIARAEADVTLDED